MLSAICAVLLARAARHQVCLVSLQFLWNQQRFAVRKIRSLHYPHLDNKRRDAFHSCEQSMSQRHHPKLACVPTSLSALCFPGSISGLVVLAVAQLLEQQQILDGKLVGCPSTSPPNDPTPQSAPSVPALHSRAVERVAPLYRKGCRMQADLHWPDANHWTSSASSSICMSSAKVKAELQ